MIVDALDCKFFCVSWGEVDISSDGEWIFGADIESVWQIIYENASIPLFVGDTGRAEEECGKSVLDNRLVLMDWVVWVVRNDDGWGDWYCNTVYYKFGWSGLVTLVTISARDNK